MNIEHLKTFLDVARTGSFHRSAERLHVSQSTVSARIRTLEEQTGQILFQRLKNGAVLTGPGRRMAPYADTAVRAWERGRHYLSLVDTHRIECALGIQSVLAEWMATEWIAWVNVRHPEIALRVEAGDSERLMRGLDDAFIDIAVAFRPRIQPGLKIETLYTEDLILVSSDERSLDPNWRDDYVFVDWGETFRRRLRRCLSQPRDAFDPNPPFRGSPSATFCSRGARPISRVRSRTHGSRMANSTRSTTLPAFRCRPSLSIPPNRWIGRCRPSPLKD